MKLEKLETSLFKFLFDFMNDNIVGLCYIILLSLLTIVIDNISKTTMEKCHEK